MLQRTLPAGFIAPCLPTRTDKLPSGSQWLHEIPLSCRLGRERGGVSQPPASEARCRLCP
jgi:hypothetical protein